MRESAPRARSWAVRGTNPHQARRDLDLVAAFVDSADVRAWLAVTGCPRWAANELCRATAVRDGLRNLVQARTSGTPVTPAVLEVLSQTSADARLAVRFEHDASATVEPQASGVVGALGRLTEPVLAMDQIQGNILPGFLKDHQSFLFLQITDAEQFKKWLRSIVPLIATADEVLAFNRLFKWIRHRRGSESNAVKATWINIAFSFNGLQQLTADVDTFTDASFKAGLRARSQDLGDPKDDEAEGNPANWVVGGVAATEDSPGNEADVILIVASDDRDDLLNRSSVRPG